MSVISSEYAIVNVTWQGQNGDLAQVVSSTATNEEILNWATESLRSGDIRGINADSGANLAGFQVDRFQPTAERPNFLFQIRPKVPFGS